MSPIARRDFVLVLLIASVIAVASSRPFAGGWNDGSRLATIECLVDYGTFAIDDSVFVAVPAENAPFTPQDPPIHKTGTLDRMRINGRFYSDKPPVPALFSAVIYKALQLATGLKARRDSAVFCWLMHLTGAGLPYIIAVAFTFLILSQLGLTRQMVWAITLAFAVASIAVAYAKVINGHIMLLAVTTLLFWLMFRIARNLETPGQRFPWPSWLAVGFLCGLAYTIDLGAGPIVGLGVAGWALFRLRPSQSWSRIVAVFAVLGLVALPWAVLHHAINFSISGSFGPANSNPAVFEWAGCPFNAHNITGRWNHKSFGDFLLYAIDILVGQRGFYSNNLMLYLPAVGLPVLLRTKFREKPEFLCGLFWCAGVYLMYATLSKNYAGGCLSIRWFVPLLAPSFLALALLLRHRPELSSDFFILTGWNLVWILPAWWYGPWWRPTLYLYWFVLACGLIHWTIHHQRRIWKSRPNWRHRGFVLQLFALGVNNGVTQPN